MTDSLGQVASIKKQSTILFDWENLFIVLSFYLVSFDS